MVSLERAPYPEKQFALSEKNYSMPYDLEMGELVVHDKVVISNAVPQSLDDLLR